MLEVAIVSMNVALHGLPEGCETTPEGYTVLRDYRMADPSSVPPAASASGDAAAQGVEVKQAAVGREAAPMNSPEPAGAN